MINIAAARCKKLKFAEARYRTCKIAVNKSTGSVYIEEVMDEQGTLFDLSVSPSVRQKTYQCQLQERPSFSRRTAVQIDCRPRCIAILPRNFVSPNRDEIYPRIHSLSLSLFYINYFLLYILRDIPDIYIPLLPLFIPIYSSTNFLNLLPGQKFSSDVTLSRNLFQHSIFRTFFINENQV